MPSRAPHRAPHEGSRVERKAGGARGSALSRLAPAQQGLVVTLPAQVLITAIAGRSAVAESLSGLNAIAAGSDLPSPLVRDVVDAIFAEADPVAAHAPPAGVTIDDACRAAARALAATVPAAETQAYCAWLQSIARRAGGGESICATLAEAFRTP